MCAQAPMVSVGEEPAMVVAALRTALAEIDELSAERASIEEALKEERNRDNILPKLMASSGRSDNIFTDEIKKYDELKVGLDSCCVLHNNSGTHCNKGKMHADDKRTAHSICGMLLVMCMHAANDVL